MPVPDALAPRWRGQSGRLEVWYATVSDPDSATGFWVHEELVAPSSAQPYVHGWAAFFRESSEASLERFGPEAAALRGAAEIPVVSGASISPTEVNGVAGRLHWDLRLDSSAEDGATQGPLFTFPSWAWEREVLPGAQIVPVASARFEGVIDVGTEQVRLGPRARGGVAHIYGHGNAERWGWLHAELGNGDVLEVVSAVSRVAALRVLKPLSFVQLRAAGRDWPRDPMLAAPLFRSHLGLPSWNLSGTIGRHRLRVDVDLAPERTVEVQYVDPDGDTATCTNSEIADAEVVVEHRRSRWEVEARWSLKGTAHAEIGTRP